MANKGIDKPRVYPWAFFVVSKAGHLLDEF
jgi:hypothetical protein